MAAFRRLVIPPRDWYNAVMYLEIVVPRPIDRTFTYRCPASLLSKVKVGKRVRVPFGRQKETGYIVGVPKVSHLHSQEILKDILDILDDAPVLSEEMLHLSSWIASYYHSPWGVVLKTLLPGIGARVPGVGKKRMASSAAQSPDRRPHISDLQPPPLDPRPSTPAPLLLNPEQQSCLDQILPHIGCGVFNPFLLHGVTGSGKTEIYLRSVDWARKKNMGSIVLVPEISLTSQLVDRFRERFQQRVAVFHSGLTNVERGEAWMAVQEGRSDVVIGTRSAVFAPFRRVGVIVVDEEHDSSYKQEEGLRYHARDVAVFRAREAGAVVILGSATPSLESFHHASHGKYRYLTLPYRIDHRPLPAVHVVDMRSQAKPCVRPASDSMEISSGRAASGKSGQGYPVFSPLLKAALEERLKKGEQSLLFLNRRGYFPLLLCEDCGQTPECLNCSISLTYHRKEHRLKCHACDFTLSIPEACPGCQGSRIKAIGIGTERVESVVKQLFPGARVIRMDRDTTRKKAAHVQLLDQMLDKKADILIGTQMVTKGLDFPDLTLVGVILADTGLHLPDFRAGERTFQLLTQVAGRTGRGAQPGEVIVQTYNPEHPTIRYAASHDYEGFSKAELELRKGLCFPPYRRLARLLFVGNHQNNVESTAGELLRVMKNLVSPSEEVLGPAPAPLVKLRGKFRWQAILKCRSTKRAHALIVEALDRFRQGGTRHGVRIEVDMDPQSLL